MIRLKLDHHDLLFAIEGFARGSHLRQHVWQQIVYKSIPQMSNDDLDFLWYFCRRDLFGCYFPSFSDGRRLPKAPGWLDYLHGLAALHRSNRFNVVFVSHADNKKHKALCYRFDGLFRPLVVDSPMRTNNLEGFHSYIPSDDIVCMRRHHYNDNKYVPDEHLVWWQDIDIYEHPEDVAAESLTF